MGISGNLKTMVLAELLQWLSQGQKTGTLVFDGGDIEKKVFFDGGKIISSASTDPTEYLGSFLVAYGYVTEEQVDEAIARQKEANKLIGKLLVDLGAIGEEELQQTLQLKAEESIYDIFTWEEAAFEFLDGDLPEETMIRMDMDVQYVVLEGTRRLDEWNQMKQVVPSEHCVPVAMTDLESLEGVDETDARILGWIDDERSIEEISQGAHTGKFLVMQAIVEQVKAGNVKAIRPKIVEVRVEVPVEKAPGDQAPAPPQHPYPQAYPYYPPPQGATPPPGSWPMAEAIPMPEGGGGPGASSTVDVGGQQLRFATSGKSGPGSGAVATPRAPTAAESAPAPAVEDGPRAADEPPAQDAAGLLRQAGACREQGSYEVALDRLKKAKAAGAGEDRLREEQEKLQDDLEGEGIKLSSVPRLSCDVDELMKLDISPKEGFMLTRVDGSYDIKSILKMSSGIPRADAQVLFWKLRESGHVKL